MFQAGFSNSPAKFSNCAGSLATDEPGGRAAVSWDDVATNWAASRQASSDGDFEFDRAAFSGAGNRARCTDYAAACVAGSSSTRARAWRRVTRDNCFVALRRFGASDWALYRSAFF